LANGKDRIQPLIDEWRQTTAPIEIARRLIDLFVVSVLLDAGAGPAWKYREDGDEDGVGAHDHAHTIFSQLLMVYNRPTGR
jgi:hypothetical protein